MKVAVGTGSDAKDFYIHEDILKRHSDFFCAALRNDWREACEGVIRLPEDDPEAFLVFANFLYSGQLSIARDPSDPQHCDEVSIMIASWLLGDKILSDSFKDAIVDRYAELTSLTGRCAGVHLPRIIYNHSNLPSGLKRLLVDIAVLGWLDGSYKCLPREIADADFFAETTLRALQIPPEQRHVDKPWVDCGCRYHDHGEETPCYKTMF